MWVSPFGNPRINAYVQLPAAYRSLSRPSSAPDAKAFPLRPLQLDLFRFSRIMQAISTEVRNCYCYPFISSEINFPQYFTLLLRAFSARPLLSCFTLHCSVFKVQSNAFTQALIEIPIRRLQSTLKFSFKPKNGGPKWTRTTDLTIISRTL